jgi:GxxExxY protein
MNADSSGKDSKTYQVIGAAMEVHRELRRGFLEVVYQDALAVEFSTRDIPFERERLLNIRYKGGILPSFYKADFTCFSEVLVECKAQQTLSGNDDAQVLNYLRITGIPIGLLINFGTSSLEWKRLIFSPEKICVNLCQSVDPPSL